MNVDKFINYNVAIHTQNTNKGISGLWDSSISKTENALREFYDRFTKSMLFVQFIDHCTLPTSSESDKENIIFFDEWVQNIYNRPYPLGPGQKPTLAPDQVQSKSHRKLQSFDSANSLRSISGEDNSSSSDNAAFIYSPNFRSNTPEPDSRLSTPLQNSEGRFPDLRIENFTGLGLVILLIK